MPGAGFRNPHEPTGFRVITGDHQHHQHFKTFVDVGIGKKMQEMFLYQHVDVNPKIGVFTLQKWMVKIMDPTLLKRDDLGVPLFFGNTHMYLLFWGILGVHPKDPPRSREIHDEEITNSNTESNGLRESILTINSCFWFP